VDGSHSFQKGGGQGIPLLSTFLIATLLLIPWAV
jgi:hypothetical protein